MDGKKEIVENCRILMGIINSDYTWYFLPSFNENFNNIWLSIHKGNYPNE